MIENLVLVRAWLPAALWVVLYAGDYLLTLWGARLYSAQAFVKVEGSYELTPFFQRDVDNQRRLSPRFIASLIFSTAFLLLIGFLPDYPQPHYDFIIGCMVVLELGVWTWHIRNIILYRELSSPSPGVTGQIEWKRSSVYRQSAVESAVLSGFLLLLSALTGSPMLLGGGYSMACLAFRHFRLARRLAKAVSAET